MTEVGFYRDKGSFTFKIRGHAGDSAVCNGCSTLGYTLLNAVLRMEAHNQLVKPPVYRDDPDAGELYIRFTPGKGHRRIAAAIAYTFLDGYRLLADEYPKNVKICG